MDSMVKQEFGTSNQKKNVLIDFLSLSGRLPHCPVYECRGCSSEGSTYIGYILHVLILSTMRT